MKRTVTKKTFYKYLSGTLNLWTWLEKARSILWNTWKDSNCRSALPIPNHVMYVTVHTLQNISGNDFAGRCITCKGTSRSWQPDKTRAANTIIQILVAWIPESRWVWDLHILYKVQDASHGSSLSLWAMRTSALHRVGLLALSSAQEPLHHGSVLVYDDHDRVGWGPCFDDGHIDLGGQGFLDDVQLSFSVFQP